MANGAFASELAYRKLQVSGTRSRRIAAFVFPWFPIVMQNFAVGR
jgi:hypothetical protein